jgi:hypothetical protein
MRYEKQRRVALARTGARQSERGRWLVGRVYSRESVGVERRLRALARMGWRASDIAAETGIHQQQIQRYMRGGEEAVFLATHLAIATAYDRLSMTPGPSKLARQRAEAKGWPPPLAWDDHDLDNPDAQPKFGKQHYNDMIRRLPDDRQRLAAEVNRDGVTLVAERYDVTPGAVNRALTRAGYRAVTRNNQSNGEHPIYRKDAA